MFIASLICLILGIGLIGISIYMYFKLDVREALNFIRNKRTGRNTVSSSSRIRRRPNLKSSGKTKLNVRSGLKKKAESSQTTDDKAIKKSKKRGRGSDSETDVLNNYDSEAATGILAENSETPTGVLVENSETPTGVLGDSSESPTGILVEESETPTGVLAEESETPTGVLAEESETPTGILNDESEEPTGVLDEKDVINKKKDIKKKTKKAKTVDSDFKFDVVKEVIIVHTDETIE